MSYADYINVCTIFLASNDRNISEFKSTESKKLCNLLLNNIGNISKATHNPDEVIFNFSSF